MKVHRGLYFLYVIELKTHSMSYGISLEIPVIGNFLSPFLLEVSIFKDGIAISMRSHSFKVQK